jgi:glucokinase
VATVGVDIGGTKVRAVVLDHEDEVVGTADMRTPSTGDRAAVVEVLLAGVYEAIDRSEVPAREIDALGVGSPGVVVDGTVAQAVNVPGWSERFRLAEMLGQELDIPARIVNDTTALAVAEHRLGAGRGRENLLVVSVGTGVGGGLILGGQVFEGAFGAAGEFGHTVVEIDGAVCPCGRRGCVEAYAGRRAVVNAVRRAVDAERPTSLYRIADELGLDRPTSRVFKAAIAQGDPLVADLIDAGARALGKGIASAVNLLDVEMVVVGGPMTDQLGPQYVARIDAAARPNLFLQPPRVEIVPSLLGDPGTAVGAALVARG